VLTFDNHYTVDVQGYTNPYYHVPYPTLGSPSNGAGPQPRGVPAPPNPTINAEAPPLVNGGANVQRAYISGSAGAVPSQYLGETSII
jgi:hypothetical protein